MSPARRFFTEYAASHCEPMSETATHLRITPTDTRPAPAQTRTAFENLHALAQPSDTGGWRELFADQTPPAIEWLLQGDGDGQVTYYVGPVGDLDLNAFKRVCRDCYPDDYQFDRVADPLDDTAVKTHSEAALADGIQAGIEYHGHARDCEDWLTQLTPATAFLDGSTTSSDANPDHGHASLPLAAIADTMADVDRPMIYQTLLQSLPDYTAETEYFREHCLSSRTVSDARPEERAGADPTAPEPRALLTPELQTRIEELAAKDARHLFTVNARLLVGEGDGDHAAADSPARSLTSALSALSRTGYCVEGDRATGADATALAERIAARTVSGPDYGGLATRLPGVSNRSRGIVADATEVGGVCLLTGESLASPGSRAIGPTPGERTGIERPPTDQLDTYRTPGLALGTPVDADGSTDNAPVQVPPALQPLHAAWFGRTGSGKSTALVNAIRQNHDATAGADILIDPKGDGMATEYLRAHYAAHGSLDDVYYFDCENVLPAFSFFDIRDELAAGIDRETAVEDRADHYLEILVQIMGRDQFESAVRSPDVIRYLIKAAFDPVHGSDAFTHREFHGTARRMHERSSAPGVTDPDLERMLSGVVANRPQTFDNIMQGVANRIEKVPVDRRLARMFNHVPEGSEDASFDLEALLDEDAVVIFDTGGLRTRAQRVLALVVLSNLWTALRRRSRRQARQPAHKPTGGGGGGAGAGDSGEVGGLPLVNVYVEEAASIAVSDLLGELLAKARGFGCSVTLAMQFPAQLREAAPAAYEEVLNNVATVVTGNVPIEERFARRLATESMDATAVSNRLRALPRGRWLASLPAHFGEPEPRPFELASLPLPPGHPEGDDEWTAADEAGFDTAFIETRARTRTGSGLTVDRATPAASHDEGEAGGDGGDIPGGRPGETTAGAGASAGADGAAGGGGAANEMLDRVDSALPHTMRMPDVVEYEADAHRLRCRQCATTYAPTSEGMKRAIGCCNSLDVVDSDDVPICELNCTLDADERVAREWSDRQLLFLQAVHNAQQRRYGPPGYDLLSDSMLRLVEYVGIEREAVADLVEAGLLRHDTDHPHRLYSVTADGRDAIGEPFRRGVDYGHSCGDLEESSEYVVMVQLGKRYLEQAFRDAPDSPVQRVVCYYDLEAVTGTVDTAGESPGDRRRLDVVGLDDDGDVVVTLEAERINHDVRRAVPDDYDKMADCDPDAAVWVVPTESAAHRVVDALHDPPAAPATTADSAGEPEAEAVTTDGESTAAATEERDAADDWNGEPRIEKSYSETTPSSQFQLDSSGCTDVITTARLRKQLEE